MPRSPSSPRGQAVSRRDPLSLPRPLTFQELTRTTAEATEAELTRVLRDAKNRFRRHGVGPPAAELSALVLRGGKRIRAALVAAGWWSIRPRQAASPIVSAAAAVELLHAYLLVQDDWMDGDDRRRGGPSVHAALVSRFGDRHKGAASAILASDLGLGLALQCLLAVPVSADRSHTAAEILLAEHERVLIGQQLDLLGITRRLETMHALKTASYTFRGPLLIGAALAGAPEQVRAAMASYAEPLGVAFQLRDDLLGCFAPSAITGKPFAGDLREGKVTAVTERARSTLRGAAARRFAAAWGRKDAQEQSLRVVVDDMEAAGVGRDVGRRVAALSRRARAVSLRLPIDPRARTWLGELVDLVAKPVHGSGGEGQTAWTRPSAGGPPGAAARRQAAARGAAARNRAR